MKASGERNGQRDHAHIRLPSAILTRFIQRVLSIRRDLAADAGATLVPVRRKLMDRIALRTLTHQHATKPRSILGRGSSCEWLRL